MKKDLVFLHGGKHGSWCWKPLEDVLRHRGYEGKILSLDVPGCGVKRARDTTGLGIDEVSDELNADVAAASLRSPVLVGHSQAGILLPRMVVCAPNLYSEAVFLATCAPAEGQSVTGLMGLALHGEDPEHVGWPIDPRTATPDELAAALFGADLTPDAFSWLLSEYRHDNWPELTGIGPVSRAGFPGNTPVSYIATLRDQILPPVWQGRFAERVHAKRLFLLDTPHEPFVSHPNELADILLGIV